MADIAVRRLIALLGHLTPGARIAIADLAERLGTSEASLAQDLTTLSLCGVAPFYPDDYMPLIIEDGFVEVFGELPALSGSIRLSPDEAGALAAALQSAGFPATDPLTRRLLEAAASSGFDAQALEHTVRAMSAAHSNDVYQTLASALAHRTVVRIEYVRTGSETASTREVEPHALFAERGAWYLKAWCRSADDWRTFRVDRVRSAELTGEEFDSTDADGAPSAFPKNGLPVATLRFAAGEDFDERDWPGARLVAQEPDGTVLVEVPYAGTAWIARRVVARTGAVEVTGPPAVREAVRRLAASELARA